MYFGVSNSYSIRSLKFKGKKPIVISCLSNSEYSDIGFDGFEDFVKTLELDITDTNDFDLKNAELLNEFILNNEFDEIITYCALGMSRSPAIMICISKILDSSLMEKTIKDKYKFYNKSIVESFEKFPYKTKKLSDNTVIYYDYNDNKKLVKEINISID